MQNLLQKKKHLFIAVLLVVSLAGWFYRTEILFMFQRQRLQQIRCYSTSNPGCHSKLWAHRVNSLERQDILAPYFEGFEADVVFDSIQNRFLVYHPPFQGRVLLLKHWMANLVKTGKKAWLDMRYVQKANQQEAYAALHNLDSQFHFKEKIIIELYDITAANFFAAKGYTVSMNIPAELFGKQADLSAFSSFLSPMVTYVSQEDQFLPYLKAHFPDKKIITWSVAFKNYIALHQFESLVNDKKVEVILVNVKSRYRY